MSTPPDRMLALSTVPPGQRVQVVDTLGGQRVRHRLNALGIVRGAALTILQDNGGVLLVTVGNTRLGLARGLAHLVRMLIEQERS